MRASAEGGPLECHVQWRLALHDGKPVTSALRLFNSGNTTWKFLMRSSSDMTTTGNLTWNTPKTPFRCTTDIQNLRPRTLPGNAHLPAIWIGHKQVSILLWPRTRPRYSDVAKCPTIALRTGNGVFFVVRIDTMHLELFNVWHERPGSTCRGRVLSMEGAAVTWHIALPGREILAIRWMRYVELMCQATSGLLG